MTPPPQKKKNSNYKIVDLIECYNLHIIKPSFNICILLKQYDIVW